ncbi:hypothetical protein EIP86_011175 [Pleurotus ostreatoroseus]|nr:hypothetical protein EIP86_011175 [Pleurotus ostreatoroseus]
MCPGAVSWTVTTAFIADESQVSPAKIMHSASSEVDDPSPGLTDSCVVTARLHGRISEIEGRAEKPREMMQEMDELLRQYRALAPITSCPPEIISDIFKAYVAVHWKDYDCLASPSYYSPHRWFRILHVCRIWREVAFATPHLWTRITPTSPAFVRLAALHSGHLPLCLRQSRLCERISRESEMYTRPPISISPPPRQLASLEEIWPLLPRIRYLELCLDAAMLEDIQIRSPSMQVVVAEELEELDIKCVVTGRSLPDANVALLPTTHFPQLATLHLCCAYDDGPILHRLLRPTLTTLSLKAVFPKMLPQTLAEALQFLPLLQSLQISGFLTFQTSNVFAVTRMIELVNLRTLLLEEKYYSGRASLELLNHLTFPATTEVLLCIHGSTTQAHRDLFLRALLSRLATPGSASASITRPRSMIIGVPPRMGLKFFAHVVYLWADSHSRAFPYVEVQDVSRFGLMLRKSDDDIELPELLRRFNIADIVSLGVRAWLHRDEWVRIFRASTKVERLFIECADTAYEFLAAFSESLSQEPHGDTELRIEDSHTPSQYLFPMLKELELSIGEQKSDFLPHAVACLKRRMQQGLRLEQLKVRHALNLAPDEEHLIQSTGVVRRVDIIKDEDLN